MILESESGGKGRRRLQKLDDKRKSRPTATNATTPSAILSLLLESQPLYQSNVSIKKSYCHRGKRITDPSRAIKQ